MLREIAVVLLLGVIGSVAVDVTECPGDIFPSDTTDLGYIVGDGFLFCPDSDVTRWTFTSSETGTFSFEGDDVFSDSELCTNQGSAQVCWLTGSKSTTLYVCVEGLLSLSGTLEFVYTPNNSSPQLFTVEYAPIGISLLMENDVINAAEGSEVEIRWRVRRFSGAGDQYELFHITSDGKQLLSSMTEANNQSNVRLKVAITPCRNSMDNRLPSDYRLRFESVSVEDAGVYSFSVIISDDMTSKMFTSNITLNVMSSSTTTPISPTSTPTGTTAVASTDMNPTATVPTPVGSGGTLLVIVIAVSVVVAAFMIALVFIVVIAICVLKRRDTRSSLESAQVTQKQNGSPQKYKRSSVSSDNHPLMTSSTSSTPTTKTPDDYVSVFYEEEFTNTFKIFKRKHPDRFRELSCIEDIILAMNDSHCIDIFVVVNLRSSPIFKAMQSRAIDKEGRKKLKWLVFGKDSTPGYNLEIQDYQYVVLEGDPEKEETFSELLMKLEQPVHRPTHSPVHPHRSMNSDPVPLPILEERPRQGHSEMDYHPPSNDRMQASAPAGISVEMKKIMEKQIEIGQANLEENKKQSILLADISKNANKIEKNTGDVQATLETAVIDEATSSSSPP